LQEKPRNAAVNFDMYRILH